MTPRLLLSIPDPFRCLVAVAVCLGTIVLAPMISADGPVSSWLSGSAQADDDDDDDDDRPRRRPWPEFIVTVPSSADLTRIAARGFRIVTRERLALTGAETARLRPLRRLTLSQARRVALQAAPAAILDINTRYRTNAFQCTAQSCDAFTTIGWAPGPQTCAAELSIGVIDTGVDLRANALANARIESISTRSAGRTASSRIHGTQIAALLVGSRDSASPGLMPQAKLVHVDAFHRAGSADTADAYDLVRAIDRLVTRRVQVINMSFSGAHNAVLEKAVEAASASGVALVAAAGNNGPRAAPLFPAAFKSVIAVTAVDTKGNVYRQAASGDHIAFAAPGVRLWTQSGSGGRLRSGTSYAAPFVSAALALTRERASEPESSGEDLARMLSQRARDLGTPGRDRIFGWGLVQMPACDLRKASPPE